MPATSQDILDYWFGTEPLEPRGKLWWIGGDGVDRDIRERFEATVESAMAGGLDDWSETAEGTMALVIVLDQFTRNIYRGTERAFAGDAKALELVLEAVDRGFDRQLHPLMASFLLMPMEHAESMAMQDRCVACYQALLARTDDPHREYIAGNLDYARDHRELIEKFGRFPHRNRVLGRDSSPEETAYLKGGGKTYGQG